MKILQVIAEAPPIQSGVARVAAELVAGMTARGHESATLSAVQIPRVTLGEIRLSSLMFKLPALHRQLREYDVINVHGPAPTFSDLFLLFVSSLRWYNNRNEHAKLVYTYHSEIEIGKAQLLCQIYNWLHKKLTGFAAHVVVSTPSYATLLQSHLPKRPLSTIPWGVNALDGANLNKAEDFRVIFVGQLRPYKGADVAIRAMQHLPQARLDIVGGGHCEKQYQQLAQELGLSNVTFHGRASDERLLELMQQSHVLVLPSLTKAEAFGIVLLEGMSVGCVPVASELPGVRDIVGRAGLTFPINDSTYLAKILEQLRTDPALWARYSRFAREKATAYPWSRTLDEYERVYNQLYILNQARAQKQKQHLLPATRLMDSLALIKQHLGAEGVSLEKPYPGISWNDPQFLRVALKLGRLPQAGPGARFVAFSKKPLLIPDDTIGTFLDEDGTEEVAPGAELAVPFGEAQVLRVWRQRAFQENDRDWLAQLAKQLAEPAVNSKRRSFYSR